MSLKSFNHFETLCTKPIKEVRNTANHQLGINPSSAFRFDNTADSIKAFLSQPGSHVYSRYGNPTVDPVGQRIADLEVSGSKTKAYGVLTSSGMAAIHICLQSLLLPGDTVITQEILYGGTSELLNKVFVPQKIKVLNLNFSNLISLEKKFLKLKGNKVIYLETPVNPNLACVDIKAVSKIAKKFKVLVIVDNTFCTAYIQKPLLLGADIVLHSTTKFLHGHGVSMGGAIVTKDKLLMHDKIWPFLKLIGSTSNAFDAWLIHLGLKTLHIRMQRHCDNAMALANYLNQHENVQKVNYPGLDNHKDHNIAKNQMNGFGALLSFEVKGSIQNAKRVMDGLSLAAIAPSLGETDTMVLHPASSSHLRVDKKLREQHGISDTLIRVSVGIENIEDIINDFNIALDFKIRAK